jgi:hypothetical protein
MKLIEDHTSYTKVFRSLANQHRQIGHLRQGEKDIHFVRVSLSEHPALAQADLKEFIRSVNNVLRFPALVLASYRAGYSADSTNESKRKLFRGSFFILDRVPKDDFDKLEEVHQQSEVIGEEIIAYLGEHYEENPQNGLFIWDEGENEKISNIDMDNLAGTKFYFTVSVPHQAKLELNTNAFFND